MYNDLINWYNNNTYKSSIKICEFRKICELTSFLDDSCKHITPKQRMWHIINSNFNIQYCEICGKQSNFDRHKYCYQVCCSKICAKKFQSSEKWSDNCKKNYIKAELTCLEKYGVENYSKTDEYKEKYKETCLKKYGVENHMLIEDFVEKSKQTNLKIYGVEWYQQTDEFKGKYEKTCLERYGVGNMSYLSSTISKIHETKKKNGSYEKSKEENEIYYNLIELFGYSDIVRQYRDKRYYSKETKYLFACDFYIKSLDLFIEYDGIWTHKPQYLSEKERNEMIKKWKEKSEFSNYYKGAISAYNRDCLKREISREINLNIQFIRKFSDFSI